MADDSVTFSGSSAEDIENAKAFWRALDPEVKPKSALFVTGIDHRLKTAPDPKSDLNCDQFMMDDSRETEINPGLKRHQEDAEKQRILEETEEISQLNSFRNDAQQRLEQRRKERIKKEAISSRVIQRTQEPLIVISDSSDDDEDARQAMDDIEKFEAKLRQKEVIKPS